MLDPADVVAADRRLRTSVVIPTHGRSELLRRSLKSVADQHLRPTEVLVIDDLGDDDTRALLSELAASYPVPLRHVRNEQGGGACASRNQGAALATAPLIAFLDDDDEWHAGFLAACAATLATSDVAFTCAEIDRVFADGTVKHLIPPEGLTAMNVLRQRAYMTGSSFLIRKSAFEAVGGFDPTVPVFNDWDLFIRLVRAHFRYTVVHEPLVRWMEHEGERITTGTVRRADGLDRFLRVYRNGMAPGIRAYYLRLAFGIRKKHEPSRWRRLGLTLRMLGTAGMPGSIALLMRRVD